MSWTIRHFNDVAYTNSRAKDACLLIPGWGMNADIFDSILPGLAQFFQVYTADYGQLTEHYADAVKALAQKLPFAGSALVIGWSMGGNIALELAKQCPQKVSGLCLVAATPSFVERDNWPYGMSVATYQQFQQGLGASVAKTLRRFDQLQSKGDGQQAALQKALTDYRAQQEAWRDEDLITGLKLLAAFDQREWIADLPQRQLWCFGAEDQLVNVASAKAIKTQLPNANVQTFDAVAHTPFLTRSDQFFAALLDTFLHNSDEHKRKIAQSFSQAAAQYDDAARIQRWAAEHLLAQVPENKATLMLDAGCGTGRHTKQLAKKAEVLGLDIAQGMLQHAQTQYPAIPWLAADAEHLPFANDSLDGIFSSLSVQWSQYPQVLLNEWQRVLKPGGKIWLATLGSQSLQELRMSFAAVDNEPHVNRFANLLQWQHFANLAGLSVISSDTVLKNDYYPDLASLLRSLKEIGAQTVLYRKSSGMMGKQRWQALQKAYEAFRDEQGLPASYQLIFLCLQKPHE